MISHGKTSLDRLRQDIVDQLRQDIDNRFNILRSEFNNLRSWVITLFLGSIGIMTGIVLLGVNVVLTNT